MRQSKLFGQTIKESPKDEVSVNADLLYRAGYIEKLMAGVYTYLPLGLRVLQKVKQIVREEMNAIGGQEMIMPALQPKELWERTGRWQKLKEIMFQFKGRGGSDIGLACTHEEVLTDILSRRVKSYKDLPLFLYQMQNKFRNEPRAKSGLLRGREFSMKDLYSFHPDEESFNQFYELSKRAYLKVYQRCNLNAIITEAPGGDYTTRATHEFQVPAGNGEDTIFVNQKGDYAWNQEVVAGIKDGDPAPDGSGPVKEMKSIEVGNIFPLETTYSNPLELNYTDEDGRQQPVVMGSYGIGLSRVMGSIVEIHHDDKGIIWPKQIAPYEVHLLAIGESDSVTKSAEAFYSKLQSKFEVLFDDRVGISAGQKFADSDLIGIPIRMVVSEKTLKENCIEFKSRNKDNAELVSADKLDQFLEGKRKS